MKPLSCEAVTDLLPDRVRGDGGGIGEIDRRRLERHLARCAPCRAESELLGLIADARPAVPAGLHARVASAVAGWRAPKRRVPAGMAAAAGIVLALVTGGLLVIQVQSFEETAAAGTQASAATIQDVRPYDPLLSGGPQLARLSVDELATLLAEMDR